MTNQETVIQIVDSYTEKAPSKLDELKKFDKKVRRPSTVFAYVFGTISALVLGVGMCLAMKVIGDIMAVGIVIGVVGIAMCIATYPIYKKMLRSAKRKNADKIKQMSDALLNA